MRWRVHPDVVWIGDDEEIRLYDSGRGEFETLNATAAAIWRLAAAGRTPDEMVAELAGTFGAADDAQRRRIGTDVGEFLDELTGRGILVAEPGSGRTAATGAATGPAPVAELVAEPVAETGAERPVADDATAG
jgi:hypothetical protein